MAYPATAQEMVDRLLADRPFLIAQVVADNYPEVRARFAAQLQSDQPQLINTPEKLTEQLIWWDTYQGGADVTDAVLAVPFRNATGSAVLQEAVTQLANMASQSDGHPKGLTEGLVAFVGALNGSNAQQTAAAGAQAATAAEQAAAEARRREASARRVRAVLAIVLLLALVALIWYLKRR